MELRDQSKKTEYGSIPKDWTIKSLNHQIDLLTGFPFPSSHYSRNGVRLLRGSNVKRGVTDWNPEITQYWPKVTPDLKEYLMNEGDIVVAMDGSLVGKSFARLSRNDVPSLLLQRVARIRSTKIDLGYLKEFVCSDYFTKYCDTVKTSSAIPHISPSDIRNFRIPVPPTKSEQTAIATALSDADALIASLEKLIAKKRLIKQGVMQKLLEPKEGWEENRLEEITEKIIGGGTPSRSNPNYWNGNIPWATVKDFATFDPLKTQEYISKEGLKNSSSNLISKGTIITTTRMALGKAVIYNVDVAINQDLKAIQLKSHYDTLFIYYWFQFNENKIKELGSGSTVMGISLSDLRQLQIHAPSLDEQRIVSKTLQDVDDEITRLEVRLNKIKSIKQGMMQTLLTGKIRLV